MTTEEVPTVERIPVSGKRGLYDVIVEGSDHLRVMTISEINEILRRPLPEVVETEDRTAQAAETA